MNKMSNLTQRAITAVIGVSLLLSLLFYGSGFAIQLFVGFLSLGMVYEFSNMAFGLADKKVKTFFLLFFTAIFQLLIWNYPYALMHLVFLSFLLSFAVFLFLAKQHAEHSIKPHFVELTLSCFGFTYLSVLPCALVFIRFLPSGKEWLILFFILIWVTDTGAYFGGRLLGRRLLYKEISPKKTLEGAITGTVFAVIAVWFFSEALDMQVSIMQIILTASSTSIASQIGDLSESLLKRAFGCKDSGRLLPGHGGLLDRFDSVVFAAPIMYACILLV